MTTEISTDICDLAYKLLDEWDSCKRIVPAKHVVFNYKEKDFIESKAFEIRSCIFIWNDSKLKQACAEFSNYLSEYKKKTVYDILAN